MMMPPPTPNAPERSPPRAPVSRSAKIRRTDGPERAESEEGAAMPRSYGCHGPAPRGLYGGSVTTPGPVPPQRVPGPWLGIIALALAAFGVAIILIMLAQQVRDIPEVASFIDDFPGDTEPFPDQPVGFPAWLSWQHFLNAFLLVFIVRTGWQIRSKRRPPAFWARNGGRRVGIWTWFHLVLDSLWVLNGVVYWVLLFVSGQWMRLVPTGWDVIPNAVSVGIQYVSFDWPTHDGWVHYNALQLLLYGFTVFVAAPLALFTGLRLSPAWRLPPYRLLTRLVPEKPVRVLHALVMFYFLAFTIVHVALVLATGALRNLNHMYAGRDDETWIGAVIFGVSLAVMVVAWFVLRPAVVKRLAALSGTVR